MRKAGKTRKSTRRLNHNKKAKISYLTVGACIGILSIGLGVGFSVRTNEVRNDESILTNNENRDLSIASGTIVVEPGAYQNNGIKSLTLPASVTNVGRGAFLKNSELAIVRLSQGIYTRLSGLGTSQIQKENFLDAIFGPQVGRYESLDDPSIIFTDHLRSGSATDMPNATGVLTINTSAQLLSRLNSNYRGLEYRGQNLTELRIEGAVKFIQQTTFANNHNLVTIKLKSTLYNSIAGLGSPIEKQRRLEAVFGTQVERYLSPDEKEEFTDHIEALPLKGSGPNGFEFNAEGKIKGNVFIYVSGESNAFGWDYRKNVLGEYNIESTNVKVLKEGNNLVNLQKQMDLTPNTTPGTLGIPYATAIKFADDIGKNVEGNVIVSSYAVPGSGFFESGNTWIHSKLVNLVTAKGEAHGYQKNYRPVFFFHQGELQIKNGTTSTQYFDFLSTIISTYRDLVQDQNAPVILGGYKDSAVTVTSAWTAANIKDIELANMRLAETIPNVGYASAKGLVGDAKDSPQVHFGAESIEEFALRYFKEFRKNINDLTPPNAEVIQKGEYKLYSETRNNGYADTVRGNWIQALRSGDDTTESFSRLADIWKYRNDDGYKFKYVAYNEDDKLTVTFKQSINPMGILHSEKEKLKDLLKFELLSVEDTSGQLSINNIDFDAMAIWDTNSNTALSASKQGFINGLGHNYAPPSRENKIVSSRDKTSNTFNVADKIEFYAVKD